MNPAATTLLLLVLTADICVFYKCRTYKTKTSLLISVSLFADLALRVAELCVQGDMSLEG
jgi:predicted Kef-type K+ transport protein